MKITFKTKYVTATHAYQPGVTYDLDNGEELVELGVAEPTVVKKKRGRPKKEKTDGNDAMALAKRKENGAC